MTTGQIADNIGDVMAASEYDRLVDSFNDAVVGTPFIDLLLGLTGLLSPA